jgi:hypothetical protein
LCLSWDLRSTFPHYLYSDIPKSEKISKSKILLVRAFWIKDTQILTPPEMEQELCLLLCSRHETIVPSTRRRRQGRGDRRPGI